MDGQAPELSLFFFKRSLKGETPSLLRSVFLSGEEIVNLPNPSVGGHVPSVEHLLRDGQVIRVFLSAGSFVRHRFDESDKVDVLESRGWYNANLSSDPRRTQLVRHARKGLGVSGELSLKVWMREGLRSISALQMPSIVQGDKLFTSVDVPNNENGLRDGELKAMDDMLEQWRHMQEVSTDEVQEEPIPAAEVWTFGGRRSSIKDCVDDLQVWQASLAVQLGYDADLSKLSEPHLVAIERSLADVISLPHPTRPALERLGSAVQDLDQVLLARAPDSEKETVVDRCLIATGQMRSSVSDALSFVDVGHQAASSWSSYSSSADPSSNHPNAVSSSDSPKHSASTMPPSSSERRPSLDLPL